MMSHKISAGAEDVSRELTPGEFVLVVVSALEEQGCSPVYLRNHERLPEEIGNDVDLLVGAGSRGGAEGVLRRVAAEHGWRWLATVEFGPLSVFFADPTGERFLHIDLFDRLEVHWLEFANAHGILKRRQWNSLVHIPDRLDEVAVNVLTRLLYQGKVRDKHRVQAAKVLGAGDSVPAEFSSRLAEHVGPRLAGHLGPLVVEARWEELERWAGHWRRALLVRCLLRRPHRALTSLARYLRRSLGRLIRPPGRFYVFEGADGVGKSTVIDGMATLAKGLSGRSDTLIFHWKPARRSVRLMGERVGAAQDPRGQAPRSAAASLLFLVYHWLGFWSGYLRYVLPARVKNRVVIADRYSYEFFLDPKRLRLRIPCWLARLAAQTVPQPDAAFFLHAEPDEILRRKPELSRAEIEGYQARLVQLASRDARIYLVDANGTPLEVLDGVREVILKGQGNPSNGRNV